MCFNGQNFPYFVGSTTGTTYIYKMDVDSAGHIAIGGSTSATSLLGTTVGDTPLYSAFVMYITSKGFTWAKRMDDPANPQTIT